jgi:uncharacterized membrane-anchored protein YhcB (DUF1043 family)
VSDRSHARQLMGSLLAAAVIVAIAIAIVTLRFGPTSAAEQESLEERQEQRLDAQEERRKDAQDAREDGGG